MFELGLAARLWYDDILLESSRGKDGIFFFDDKACLAFKDGFVVLTAMRRGLFRLELEIICPFGSVPEAMIPSVWYDGNSRGEGLFPSARMADHWHFEETRMAVPAMIVLSDGRNTVAASLSPASRKEILADVSWTRSSIVFRIPAKEEPFSYRGKKSLIGTAGLPCSSFFLAEGEKLERKLNLMTGHEKRYETYAAFVKRFYPLELGKPEYSWQEYEETKLVRLLNMVRCDESGKGAFLVMGEGNGEVDVVYRYTSGSFLVKSLEAAVRFAQTPYGVYRRANPWLVMAVGRIRALFSLGPDENPGPALARRIADYFLRGELLPGRFQDCISLETGEIGGYLGIGEHPEFRHLINARCNGEAMCAYLRLYEFFHDTKYLELCTRVASFYLVNQLESGSYGRWFSPDGRCIDTNGTNGAYIGVFLLGLARLMPHRDDIRKSVSKAARYYALMAEMENFYADTLDADSADKEAGIAILSFLLEYMETYKSSEYIEQAVKAAYFISTWVWQDESFIPPQSPLKREGFSTKGMSAVSVAHHHLDFYGMLIARDFLRLHALSGDGFFYGQALLMLSGSLQLIRNERHALGRSERFYGYQPEQINHTSWDYFSFEDRMNGSYGIDIAWVNVLGYGAYIDIRDRFREVLDEVQRGVSKHLEY